MPELIPREFDATYYARYYFNEDTRVAEPAYYDNLARFIAAYSGLLSVRMRSILDLGCGTGTFKKPLLKRFPKSRYCGVDVSAYACERYGWERGSVVDYVADPFDLVVCHDVLQYLNTNDAKQAMRNLDVLCDGLLYFSVLTTEDWEENCDRSRTDADVTLRPAEWYRSRLKPYFKNLGGGAYLSRKCDIALYALEHLD
jgi:SAM-dependent methyltransferase